MMLFQLDVVQPASCDGCGLCCEGVGSPVLLYSTKPNQPEPHPFRPKGIPRELIEEIDRRFGGLVRGQEPLHQCLWFDAKTLGCKHYEWRPPVCRDYEMGGLECLNMRRPHVEN